MNIDKLNSLKENEEIKFIFKIPCSLFDDGFKYIIVGNVTTRRRINEFYYSLED